MASACAAFGDYEKVLFANDRASGLQSIIAVHDTTLGPALGGCRMWPYASMTDAIDDVLRLARAMTYKNAMADLPLGGGKAVVRADPRHQKTDALLRAFGRAVDALGGAYVTAEDVGMTVADIETIGTETRFVSGRSSVDAGSGDPGPVTAYGVFVGILAAVRHRLGRDGIDGVRVAIQGVGSVGYALCRHLTGAGADVLVSDLDARAVDRAVGELGARPVAGDVLRADVDVFAPCALGGVLGDATIPALRASIVAGSANNQLALPHHGDALAARNILYAPDYVINAGGVVNVAAELSGHYDLDEVRAQVERIDDRLTEIFRRADAEGASTSDVADAIAREKLDAARKQCVAVGGAAGDQSPPSVASSRWADSRTPSGGAPSGGPSA